jgi:hypothetical protein
MLSKIVEVQPTEAFGREILEDQGAVCGVGGLYV